MKKKNKSAAVVGGGNAEAEQQSVLVLERTLRESPAPLEALAWSRRSGLFLSVDGLALRLWTTERQVKACHRAAGDDNAHTLGMRVFSAFALETADDAFAVVFGARKKGLTSCVQVWSGSLTLLHEVGLSCPPLQFMTLAPGRSTVVLVDTDSNIFSFKMTIASISPAAHSTPSYSKTKSGEAFSPTGHRRGEGFVTHFHLSLLQVITNDSEKDEQILGVKFTEENKFVVLDIQGFKIYSRDAGGSAEGAFLVGGPRPRVEKRRMCDEIETAMPFSMRQTVSIDFSGKIPCGLLCIATNSRFVVGYFDGTVQILDVDENSVATVTGQVQAHSCSSGNVENISLELCQWQTSPGGFEFEILSIGPDRNVIITAFRKKSLTMFKSDDESAVTDAPSSIVFDAVVVGRYQVPNEPPSHLVSRNPGKASKIGNVLTLVLGSSSLSTTPCRRQLALPAGGMLMFLNFHLPHRLIWGCTNISSSALAPSAQSFRSEQGNEDNASPASLLLLVNGVVKLVEPSSGLVFREFDTLHLDEARDPDAVFDRISAKNKFGRIGEDNSINSVTKFREGRATVAYWCSLTKRVVVGFSTGGIGFIDALSPINSAMKYAHLDTFKTHDSSILQVISFEHATPNSHRTRESKLYLLAGDEKGVLSLWRVSRTSAAKTWSAEAHNGAIISMQYLVNGSPSSSPVIVTACRAGFVKAWVQHSDGTFLLTSYFTASEPMSAFTSCLVVDNFSSDNQQLQQSSVADVSAFPANSASVVSVVSTLPSSAQLIMQSSLSEADFGSTIDLKKTTRSAGVIRVICVCGMSTGIVVTWVLSTEAGSKSTPLWKDQNHTSPISLLTEVKGFGENGGTNLSIMCASAGGSVTIFDVSPTGYKVSDRNFFTLPVDIKNILVIPSWLPTMGFEPACVVVANDSALEIVTSGKPSSLSMQVVKQGKQGEVLEEIFDKGEGEEEEEEDEMEDSNAMEVAPEELDYENSEFSAEGRKNPSILDYNNSSQDLDVGVDNQKQVELEYHFIRKDRKFIEIFQQNQRNRCGFVHAQVAVNIVHQWLDASSIGQDVVWQLMKHLGVSDGDELEFIKVAKVAAIASSAVKRKLQETSESLANSGRLWSDYRSLKTSHKTITYNSVGEPIHFEADLQKSVSDGLLNGSVNKLRAELSKLPSRAIPPTVPTKLAPALLLHLPKKISKLVLKEVELPKCWDPSMNHWLDLRRTVRVARTLLDMRTTKQHEVSVSLPSKRKPLKIQHLPKLLALYYERVFGSIRLNVASHKIVHYLEACLQYSQWPIIGIMQRFLCPTNPVEEFSDRSLWILVELRKFLYSSGCVIDGEAIPSINVMGDMEEKDDPNGLLLKWQLVSKSDALNAVNEMFACRGNYGVICVQRLLETTRSLPSMPSPHATLENELVDLEQFLYAIIAEFSIIEHFIVELDQIVFGIGSIPLHKVATSRDITRDILNKVPVDRDGRDAKLHQSLDRIRALAEQFIFNDPLRTGTVDELTFRSIVVVAGDAIMGFECGRDAHKLVDLCLRKFKSESPDSDVCYLDFWATLLAYLHDFQGGTAGLTGSEALNAMTSSFRGLDVKQASALSLLLQYMPCPQRDGFTWTTGLRKAEIDSVNKKIISKQGRWKRDVTIQMDLPGALSVHEMRPSADITIIPPRIEIKEQINAVPIATLPDTNRGMSTLSGEIFKPSKSITRLESKVPLHLADLSVGAFLGESGASGFNQRSATELKTLNSSTISRHLSQASATSEQTDDNELGFYPSLDEKSEFSDDASALKLDVISGQQNASFETRALDAASILDNKLLALDGMEKRRIQLLTEDQVLLQKQQQEAEEFSRRRALRNVHQKKMRREHRSKEKNWLEFKEKEDNVRHERKQRGIELYEKALKAQRDDERKAASLAMERVRCVLLLLLLLHFVSPHF